MDSQNIKRSFRVSSRQLSFPGNCAYTALQRCRMLEEPCLLKLIWLWLLFSLEQGLQSQDSKISHTPDEFWWIRKSPSSQHLSLVVLQEQTCNFILHSRAAYHHCYPDIQISGYPDQCIWKHLFRWSLIYSLYNSFKWVQYKSWSNWKVDAMRQVNTPVS